MHSRKTLFSLLGAMSLLVLTGCPNNTVSSNPDPVDPQPSASPVGSLGVALAMMPSNSWIVGTPMSHERGGLSAGVIGPSIYAIGGDGEPSVELYDPLSNTWKVKALPVSRDDNDDAFTIFRSRYFGASTEIGGRIVYIGGTHDFVLGRYDIYDPHGPSWLDVRNLTSALPIPPRMALTATPFEGLVYVTGGLIEGAFGTLQPTATVEAYDFDRGQTYAKTLLPAARAGHGSGVLETSLYVVGGYQMAVPVGETGTPEATSSLLRYQKSEWHAQTPGGAALASLNVARHSFGTAVLNGKLYVAGGMTSEGELLDSVEEYDPAANRWTLKAPMPSARAHLALTALDGRLYALGGFDEKGLAVRNVDVFRP